MNFETFDVDSNYIMVVSKYYNTIRKDTHYVYSTLAYDQIIDKFQNETSMVEFFKEQKQNDVTKDMLRFDNQKITSLAKREQIMDAGEEIQYEYELIDLTETCKNFEYYGYIGTSSLTYVFDIYRIKYVDGVHHKSDMLIGIEVESPVDSQDIERPKMKKFLEQEKINKQRIYDTIKKIGQDYGMVE